MFETTILTPDAIDLAGTLAQMQHGPSDPGLRIFTGTTAGSCEAWRATRTPEGPATVHIRGDAEAITARAWGPGASWAIGHVGALVGCDDQGHVFEAHHEAVADARRRFRGLRVGRSNAVFEAMLPSILEQKVDSHQAHASYAGLITRFGEPAPGPADMPKLFVPPSAEVLAALPYTEYHQFGIERRRADTVRRVAARGADLERWVELPSREAQRRFTTITGVGKWTAAEVAGVAFGDPDALSLGDFHLPHIVSWALLGRHRSSDSEMLELLEPYRGQRRRVVRLLHLAVGHPPRRAPRLRHEDITRI